MDITSLARSRALAHSWDHKVVTPFLSVNVVIPCPVLFIDLLELSRKEDKNDKKVSYLFKGDVSFISLIRATFSVIL